MLKQWKSKRKLTQPQNAEFTPEGEGRIMLNDEIIFMDIIGPIIGGLLPHGFWRAGST